MKDYIQNSRNCVFCNKTKGYKINKNGFIELNLPLIKTTFSNETQKFIVTLKKISGNGKCSTKTDNFVKNIIVSNSTKIEIPYNCNYFCIFRDNTSIGEVAVVNIEGYINKQGNMGVVKNKKLTSNVMPEKQKIVKEEVQIDLLMEKIKLTNNYLENYNVLVNVDFCNNLKLFKALLKSYNYNVIDITSDIMHDDYYYYFISKSKYIICDEDFYLKNKHHFNNKHVFLHSSKNTPIQNVDVNLGYEDIIDNILFKYKQTIPNEDKNFRFKIIVPSYNVEKWINKTLDSIACQKYKNYDVVIIDDLSTDQNQRQIIKEYCEKYNGNNKWKYIFNNTRKNSLYNIMNGIYNIDCKDEDVIVILDGDDWFFDENVLSKLNYNYSNYDVDVTYGQYICYPKNEFGHCRKISEHIIKNKLYRKTDWMLSHLKTFKFKLFKKIKRDDFLDTNGSFMKMAGDLAVMFPVAEMAGDRIKFISDILYTYNIETPLNDNKVCLSEQVRLADLIRRRPVYPTI